MSNLAAESWTIDGQTLHCGDARSVCTQLPVGYYDAIVTDPPYGEKLVTGDDSPAFSAALFREVLTAALPALRPAATVAFFSSTRSVDALIDAGKQAGLEFRRLLFMYVSQGSARPYRGWIPKTQPIVLMYKPGRYVPAWQQATADLIHAAMLAKEMNAGQIAKALGVSRALVGKWFRTDRDTFCYPSEKDRVPLGELLGIAIPPPQKAIKRKGRSDLYVVPYGKAETDHKCEKPLFVVRDIISRVGPRVLDPFAGSGTALLAARECGMQCTGIEIEREHCQLTLERLRQRQLFPK